MAGNDQGSLLGDIVVSGVNGIRDSNAPAAAGTIIAETQGIAKGEGEHIGNYTGAGASISGFAGLLVSLTRAWDIAVDFYETWSDEGWKAAVEELPARVEELRKGLTADVGASEPIVDTDVAAQNAFTAATNGTYDTPPTVPTVTSGAPASTAAPPPVTTPSPGSSNPAFNGAGNPAPATPPPAAPAPVTPAATGGAPVQDGAGLF